MNLETVPTPKSSSEDASSLSKPPGSEPVAQPPSSWISHDKGLLEQARTFARANPEQAVRIRYTNWRGYFGVRTIVPVGVMTYGTSQFHPTPQWLIIAYDVEKDAMREFAWKDIASVEPAI